jgi:hypothetical protein
MTMKQSDDLISKIRKLVSTYTDVHKKTNKLISDIGKKQENNDEGNA